MKYLHEKTLPPSCHLYLFIFRFGKLALLFPAVSLNSTFYCQVLQEAVQRNDEYKVYCQMAAIYANSKKTEEAEKIYKILLKKFPKEKDVWIR